MAATPLPTDADRLAALAWWLDQAARWLDCEVQDSRLHLSEPEPEEDADPEHRVEVVTFLTAELDAMRGGLRCVADILAALSRPLPGPIAPITSTPAATMPRRPRTHLRVVK